MVLSTIHNKKPINILLVEDDDGDVEAVRRAFESTRASYRIWRAADGVEALDMLRGKNNRKKIDAPLLLFVDIHLPRMDGLQMLKCIREDKDLRHIVSFILSSSKRDEDKKAAYELNIAGYISKAALEENVINVVNLVDAYRRAVDLPLWQ